MRHEMHEVLTLEYIRCLQSQRGTAMTIGRRLGQLEGLSYRFELRYAFHNDNIRTKLLNLTPWQFLFYQNVRFQPEARESRLFFKF